MRLSPPPGSSTETFASRLESHGDATALIDEAGVRISYAELARRADAFAARLGSAPRLLMIEAANAVEPVCAYLGALRAGHPVLMSAGGPTAQRIVDTYRPDAILYREGRDWITSLEPIQPEAPHPDLGLLLSTSGSTGSAKLVRLSRTAVEANALSICEYLRIAGDDVAITSLPIHYSYGLSVLNSHLARGAAVLLTDRSVIEPEFWRAFEAAGATSLAGVPYTYDLLDRVGLTDMAVPTLRTLTQAGGRLAPEAAARFGRWTRDRGARFYVMYGQTEATARMAYMPPELLETHPGAIGVPIPGGAFRLVDDEGVEITAPDTVGELVYAGPNVMMGYASSRADLARGAELDELRTGDLASRDADGIYRITGRRSRFCKLFGLRIGLDEVEAVLARRGLKAIATGDDTLLAVALVGQGDPAAERAALSNELGLPMAGIEVELWDEPPLLPSGKVDYPAILRRARERWANARAGSAGHTGVRAAFARAFPDKDLGPEDSFVSLGGDSLSYVNLSLDLESELGFLPELWEEASLETLESLAEQNTGKKRGLWGLRHIESEVVLRAAAIIAVVVNHASNVAVAGGAEVLLMLSGYNLARYQRPRLTEGAGGEVLGSFVRRIMTPYYLILLGYLLLRRELDIPSLLLVSNFKGRFGTLLEPYWFMECLLQCLLIMVALFALPPVRRWAARDPWRFGLALLGAALAVKVAAYAIFQHGRLNNRTPDAIFYMMALGWCLQQARERGRKWLLTGLAAALCGLLILGVPGFWWRFEYPSNLTHAAWLATAVGLILWRPRLSVPGWAHAVVGVLAASSFYIYLTHGVPVHMMVYQAHVTNLPVVVGAALAIGVLTWLAVQRMSQATAHRKPVDI